MKTVCPESDCVGCMACVDVCPQNCVTVIDNVKSFLAVIDESKCLNCKACIYACQFYQTPAYKAPIFWKEGWASDNLVRKNSSSGGIAGAIEKSFMETGGTVYSCAFERGEFVFRKIESIEEIVKFSGSKYVKSNPVGMYAAIETHLKRNEKVLFVGLPCQSSALQNYINTSLRDNLYTVDLICHGTPSSKILELYMKQNHVCISEVQNVRFRDKCNFRFERINNGGATYKPVGHLGYMDSYMIGFLNGLFYTESCYRCKYASADRVSDLTLGDSWGSRQNREEKEKGVSLVLCQSQKGIELINNANLVLHDADIENAIKNNRQLMSPSIMPPCRDDFFSHLNRNMDLQIFRYYPIKVIKQCIKRLLIRFRLCSGGGYSITVSGSFKPE